MFDFATLKAKRDQEARDRKARDQARIQAIDEVQSPCILLGWCTAMDTTLAKQIAFNVGRAVSAQVFGYIKKEPDTLPTMSLAEIRGIESEAHVDLLEPIFGFLNVTGLRDPAFPKPRRPQVSCGGRDAAAWLLLADAVAGLERIPEKGYRGLDGHLAQALNRLLQCGLPVVGELDERSYDWEVDPIEPSGVDSPIDERTPRGHDEEFSWDDTPEDDKTSAVPGIHF